MIEVAKCAAIKAGALLKKGFGTSYQIDTKEGAQNLVTEYDTASQKLIIDEIKQTFPQHHFLAEEGDAKDLPQEQFLWIIDPLDGTVNFAHSIPFFAISIAIAKGKDILAGVIYNPMLDELFTAQKGKGAFLGNKKLSVSTRAHFERALLATGFPYNAPENPLHCIERFGKMIRKGVPIRRLGAASLDLAYVAASRFDAFWEVGLHPWDMAAGKLLVEEAGGMISHYDGSSHQIYDYLTLLATNGHLHETMVSYLKEDLK